jgi:hypothetical protein
LSKDAKPTMTSPALIFALSITFDRFMRGYGRIYDNSTHEITHVSSFTAGGMNGHTKRMFFISSSVPIMAESTSPVMRFYSCLLLMKVKYYRLHLRKVNHQYSWLTWAYLPNWNTCFFPVHVCQRRFCPSSISMHDQQ